MRDLPEEFATLQVNYVKRISDNEYSSSCPKCGGSVHQFGELPDRFRMWIRSRATGGPLGWCRVCSFVWTPHGEKLDPAQHEKWVQERQDAEEERRRSAERALENLRREQAWVRYHENLGNTFRHHYYVRGITDKFIDYWMLGYNPHKEVWDNGESYVTPCLTIPIFLPGQTEPVTIRNRLLSPHRDGDKYRPENAGLPTSLFYTNRDTKPQKSCLVCEGEFKSMTVYITLDNPSMYVVGTPGKTPSAELMKSQLSDCDEVYFLMDPDAYIADGKGKSAIRRMVDIFKEKSRIIQVPMKIDDMIANGSMDKRGLQNLIKTARRVRL